jgi:hypothetical protein
MKGRIYSGVIFITIFFSSCFIDPCGNLDCITDNYYGSFRILSAVDGKDLLFGPSRIYDKNQIKFFTLKGTDTTYYQYEAKITGSGLDSVLLVNFFPKAELVFLKLSNTDIDTLSISHKTYQSKCCGVITEITAFLHNNTATTRSSFGFVELRK